MDNVAAMEERQHNQRSNSVYCDGHVDALRREQFFDWQNPERLRQWPANFDLIGIGSKVESKKPSWSARARVYGRCN